MARAAVIACLIVQWPYVGIAQPPTDARLAMRAQLEARAAARPADPVAWRMLGKVRLDIGDHAAALDALHRAVQLDPNSAAANFYLAEALRVVGNVDAARPYYRRVLELAPDSDYATGAKTQLSPEQVAEVIQASYEIKQFDRSDVVDRRREDDPFDDPFDVSPADVGDDFTDVDPAIQWWNFQLESGALWNTNVALAPISRDLAPEPRESAQGFANPSLELAVWDDGLWRLGPTAAGYFNLNEGGFRELNLESYQPGFFVERTIIAENSIFVPRLEYTFTLDRFGEATFGRRHAVNASIANYQDCGDIAVLYVSGDYTNFIDDGADPAFTSRDGFTAAAGFNYSLHAPMPGTEALGLGVELTHAELDGDDFRFRGIALNADLEIPLIWRTALILEGGWGYRDYPDFSLTPSRNEHILRGGAKLTTRYTDYFSASLVVSYDRFESENDLYEAERFIAGIVSTVSY